MFKKNPTSLRLTLRALGYLLSYPDAQLRSVMPQLVDALRSEGALTSERMSEIEAVCQHLAALDPLEVEARYVDNFDRGRQTSLHLFEHVHGDSRDRGPALIDLMQTYEKAGLQFNADELPDHLPVVLEFASTQPPEVAKEFLGEMAHILNALFSALVARNSPYASVTAASGVDALVHAIESYLSVNASPITDSLAIGAIKLIASALPKAYANGANLQAREDMATASLMAGMAFGNAGVGAVHALAYPLGGRFNIAHGVSNALLLPYVMTWNKMACVERMQDIAEAMGVRTAHLSASEAADKAVQAMTDLCAAVEIPAGLRSFGVPEEAIPAMAVEAAGIERLMRNNPRKLSAGDIEKIYRAAY